MLLKMINGKRLALRERKIFHCANKINAGKNAYLSVNFIPVIESFREKRILKTFIMTLKWNNI